MKKSLQKCKLAKMTISEHSETHYARAAYWSLIDLLNKISSYPVLEDIQQLDAWSESFKNAIGIARLYLK